MSTGIRPYSVPELERKWRRNLEARNLAEGTRKLYAEALQGFLRYLAFRELELHQVTWEVLEDWILHLRDEEITTSTIKGRLSAIAGFLRIACRDQVLLQNPRDLLDPMKKEKLVPRPISEAKTLDLIGAAVKPRDRAIAEFFYATGCRAREAMRVDLRDLRLDVPEVFFFGKGRKERLNPLTPAAAEAILVYLPLRAELLARLGREHEQALWISHFGTRLSYHRLYWTIRNLGAKAKVMSGDDVMHPHILRHSFCTHLVDHDAGLEVVQALGGHERPESTQVYTKLAQRRIREVFMKAHPRASKIPPASAPAQTPASPPVPPDFDPKR